jgi:molybdopterin-biosynthesis enzyme MoeA-like protein
MTQDTGRFAVIVVGDELLTGKRQNKHLPHVIERLNARGLQLAWCHIAGDDLDDLDDLVMQLRHSRQYEMPVICFGGIGATPDDNTRAAAAKAFQRPLVRHKEAARLIEKQFGGEAYPRRILMADLPSGSSLIPNPYNNIPGFSLEQHHFLPGFPKMAWPMLDWLLESYYGDIVGVRNVERSLCVYQVRESDLIGLMETLSDAYPEAKLFSLPHLGEPPTIEIGFRGPAEVVDQAYSALCHRLKKRGDEFDNIESFR